MPPSPLRNTSSRSANFSDDSIDGLNSPPSHIERGYDGSNEGRYSRRTSTSESEEDAQFPKRPSLGRIKVSDRTPHYANPFSEASGSSSGEDSDEEARKPSSSRGHSLSRYSRREGRRNGVGPDYDEEQALHSLGHHREKSEDEEEDGDRGVSHKTRMAKRAIKRARGFAISQVTKRAKLICGGIVVMLVIVGFIVGVVWWKTKDQAGLRR